MPPTVQSTLTIRFLDYLGEEVRANQLYNLRAILRRYPQGPEN
jgi:hypothetical protein